MGTRKPAQPKARAKDGWDARLRLKGLLRIVGLDGGQLCDRRERLGVVGGEVDVVAGHGNHPSRSPPHDKQRLPIGRLGHELCRASGIDLGDANHERVAFQVIHAILKRKSAVR